MIEPPNLELPGRIALSEPDAFLGAITAMPWLHLDLDRMTSIEMWALVGLCALSRKELADGVRCDVYHRGKTTVAKFAHAVGFDDAQAGNSLVAQGEPGRTVPIRRVGYGGSMEPVAKNIAQLAVPDPSEEESRDALQYVIDELLRNVAQHSADPYGAVVGAQRMDAHKGGYSRPTVQVAVADTGRGVLASLQRYHAVTDPAAAIEMALRPHISGAFPEGQVGGPDNAGLGLFFTSEMAKLTAGRLLVASRGASVFIDGDQDGGTHSIRVPGSTGTGYPGTLVVFELPIEIVDRAALMDVIRGRASERTPSPSTRNWFVYETPAEDTPRFVARDVVEDTGGARAVADRMRAMLATGQSALVDFSDVHVATQSFLHALLFQPLRVGWAMGSRIYIVHAEPAVRSGLAFLESYALS